MQMPIIFLCLHLGDIFLVQFQSPLWTCINPSSFFCLQCSSLFIHCLLSVVGCAVWFAVLQLICCQRDFWISSLFLSRGLSDLCVLRRCRSELELIGFAVNKIIRQSCLLFWICLISPAGMGRGKRTFPFFHGKPCQNQWDWFWAVRCEEVWKAILYKHILTFTFWCTFHPELFLPCFFWLF